MALKIVETRTTPICPHCERTLETLERVSKGVFAAFVILLCPHCHKVLSIGFDRAI